MKQEIIQFYNALKAKLTPADEDFIREYLTHSEQVLFYRQRIADQRHAIDTAHKILLEIEGTNWINKKRIMKTALLHDIGKAYVFMPLWVRPVAVLLKKYLPGLLSYLVTKGSAETSSRFNKYFYAYVFHPELGEKMLKELGVEKEVLVLIRMHHEPPSPKEPQELPFFRRADIAS